jgi:hypothetical protein
MSVLRCSCKTVVLNWRWFCPHRGHLTMSGDIFGCLQLVVEGFWCLLWWVESPDAVSHLIMYKIQQWNFQAKMSVVPRLRTCAIRARKSLLKTIRKVKLFCCNFRWFWWAFCNERCKDQCHSTVSLFPLTTKSRGDIHYFFYLIRTYNICSLFCNLNSGVWS